MENRAKILKYVLGCTVLSAFTLVSISRAATLEEMILQAEQSVEKATQQQEKTEKYLNKIETDYQEQLSEARKADPKNKYDLKVQEVVKKKQETAKKEMKSAAKVEKKAAKELKKEDKSRNKVLKKENKATTPKQQYIPQKKGKPVGRRPFRKSSDLGTDVYYASRGGSEILSFAAEANTENTTSKSSNVYSGTTEENVFVFPDSLANFCQIDTKSIDKMPDCINKMIKSSSAGNQAAKDSMRDLHQESAVDYAVNSSVNAMSIKNETAGFEKNVLVPLQEKSSKATDERGDIEVLTYSQMEEIKLINKLIQIYAGILAREAFNDIGSSELMSSSITNIETEYEKETRG